MKTSPTHTLRHFLVLAGSSLMAISSASALTYYWDGNDGTAGFGTATGTWAAPTAGTTTSGWSTDTTGATAIDGNSITTLNTNATTDAVNFGNGATGLGSGTIAVGTVSSGNITFAAGSGAITLSGGTINLPGTANPTITVNNTTNTISSSLVTSRPVIKAGSGTLVLSGSNTGLTSSFVQHQGGTLIFSGAAALNNRQIRAAANNTTTRIESDVSFSNAIGGFATWAQTANFQVDRQTAGSGDGLTFTNSASSNGTVSNQSTYR